MGRRTVAFSVICVLVASCGEEETSRRRRYSAPAISQPTSGYCESVQAWDVPWTNLENEVLRLVNAHRIAGASCGGKALAPVAPLAMDPKLRCAARNHSMDMAVREFFTHENPDGLLPWDRMDAAGYIWVAAAENIAMGWTTAADVMVGWMNSPGHCENIMSPDLQQIGVGYYFPEDGPAFRHYWTQVFGTPPY